MTTAISRLLLGDALEQLRTLPSESVHTCVTSPPYYNLRDYGIAGQIGNETSVEEYLQKLVRVFREVRRVLREDGTLWVNMGDSYATRSGKQPPTNTRNSYGHTEKRTPQGYKYKDLIGVPWQLAFALREDGWYLRQDIVWYKTNAMPESVKDRCTKSHEYIFCCRSQSAIISTRQQSESRLHRSRETPERSAAVAPTWAVNPIATAPAWNARAMETVRIKRAIGTSVTCGPSAQPDFAVRTLPYFLRS